MSKTQKSKLKFHQGKAGLKKILSDVIVSAQDEILLYTNQEKERDVFTLKEHQAFVQARKKRGLKIRVLAVDSPKARAMQKQDKKKNRETRLLPQTNFFTAETYIYADKVAMIAYREGILGFVINSAEFAQAQKAIFENLWNSLENKVENLESEILSAKSLKLSQFHKKKLRIGVIFGGRSNEREVSLNSGRNIYHNIDQKKYFPVPIYWDMQGHFWLLPENLVIRNTNIEIEKNLKSAQKLRFEDLTKIIDLAFLTTHGKFGDDGVLQGLLEWLNIPHTGADTLAAALGMDKWMQRKLMKQNKINLPKYEVLTIYEWQKSKALSQEKITKNLKYPLVVKPTREGSTFGVGLIASSQDFVEKTQEAFSYDNMVLYEEYLIGREFSCIVIETPKAGEIRALAPTETKHTGAIFTYEEKYLPGAALKQTPMKASANVICEIKKQSVETFLSLGFRDYARIDGFVVKQGSDEKVLITDPNAAASTGMSASSFTWHQAAEIGMNTTDFISYLINLTCGRWQR